MELTWLEPDGGDGGPARSALALLEAARQVDRPYAAGTTLTSFLTYLRLGYDGEPPSLGLAHEAGRVAGLLNFFLPRRDNTHLAEVGVVVDPLAAPRPRALPVHARGGPGPPARPSAGAGRMCRRFRG